MSKRFSFRRFLAWFYGAGAGDVADGAALSPGDAEVTNRFTGRVIRSGAFEFLADTPLGEIRGRLTDPDDEPADGGSISVYLPPECIRLDTTPPEENAFAAFVVRVEAAESGFNVRIITQKGDHLRVRAEEAPPACEPDEVLYAWIFPEDVAGG